MRRLLQTGFRRFCTKAPDSKTQRRKIIEYTKDSIVCDFTLLNSQQSEIESIIVLNN